MCVPNQPKFFRTATRNTLILLFVLERKCTKNFFLKSQWITKPTNTFKQVRKATLDFLAIISKWLKISSL